MRYLSLTSLLACAMLFTVGVNAQTIDDAQSQAASVDEAQALIDFWQAMDQAQGTIRIDAANVVLDVPDNYIFLNAKDAESVLVDAWGNMPGSNVLGMLMPAGVTPFDSNAWAVTIEYQEDGYVSDEEAEEIDYSELLSEMQSDTLEASKNRVEQGYETIELIGWASQPYYDKQAHKLHWAKELKFGGYEQNTLNYDIRVLGRRGVLVLSFIAGMEQKAEIDAVLPEVLEIANFETGNQYADFNSDTDNYAAYGLGALITGKVLAKTGFLAMLVIFLKKFGVFIVIGIGALLKGLFSRKSKQENKD
ncbi:MULTISPECIES: DUF2167 domain-containing protein [Alteromonadaceae]|uniref:DUF2167 domain-containing protein n=1 Tax=Brumicola blandensis TaxID=3075611 RepID=A0AAW8QYM8_9ALTE|nr:MULTISPECIES: DUF2167 domain-containing protein [unclassified Alteromonas]MDT0582132.1 DUF2167 domain-containing protein [Alteromonas sp. W409]MDT0627912.1 DUF2167 domain-containing protein [Alteromonas sp. W364]